MELAIALEQATAFDLRESAEALLRSIAEINRALLRALVAARQLD